ncbi:MAG: ABC transporter permease [Betaproteobacteria bacterium]|nr:ABC transporter permease [Betaproteobacteria bacterium]
MTGALAATLLRGSLSGNRWRSLLAIACIALGVALAGAVNTLHSSALDEIDRAARVLSGTADLQARGPRNGFDDAAYGPVAMHPAVAVASPVIEIEAPLAGREGTVRVLGIDPFRAARLQPGFLAQGAASRDEGTPTLLDANAAWLTPAALAKLGAKAGDEVLLKGPRGEVRIQVAGALPDLDGGGPLVVMDIAAVQLEFGRIGVIHRIDLRLAPDVPREEALRGITALLPAGVALSRPDEAAMRTAGLSQAYRVNLTALALMALFTGGFLVFSTLALQAARRRQEFALLRALGLTAAGVRTFLAIEGALLGLGGAIAGTALGLVASRAMLERFGYDLGAGFFSGTGNTFSPDATALAVIGLLGVLTAAAAALAVTRPLARLDVAQALKDRHLDLPAPPGGWSLADRPRRGCAARRLSPGRGRDPGGRVSLHRLGTRRRGAGREPRLAPAARPRARERRAAANACPRAGQEPAGAPLRDGLGDRGERGADRGHGDHGAFLSRVAGSLAHGRAGGGPLRARRRREMPRCFRPRCRRGSRPCRGWRASTPSVSSASRPRAPRGSSR